MFDPIVLISLILIVTIGLFVSGILRVDVVAMLALVACVVFGLLPGDRAFEGFGHPAVITVAAVLALSTALSRSGVIELITSRIETVARGRTAQMLTLSGIGGVLSGFINNVGALALLMPVALSMARKTKYPAGMILMPLAFATILGGLITLIGTPPNLIIATYRADVMGQPFGLFDFAWVGAPLAAVGIAFVTLVGWRLLPRIRADQGASETPFEIEGYLTELLITEESACVGKTLEELAADLEDAPAFVGLIRRRERVVRRVRHTPLQVGDVVIAQGEAGQIEAAVAAGLVMVAAKDIEKKDGKGPINRDALSLMEVVVPPRSRLENRSAALMSLRARFALNVLAIAREGEAIHRRLRDVRFKAGDVLLLQGERETLHETVRALGCLPLAERKLTLEPRRILVPLSIFLAAIFSIVVGAFPASIALVGAVVAMVLTRTISANEVYEAIDWQVIVLLAAMIPVGGVLESSGAAAHLAANLAEIGGGFPPWVILAAVLIVTMTLSDIMNNAATAVVMAPISVELSGALNLNAEPLLMAVAIGASSAFLTPIGHQNNLLVMGPGGYHFGDYWRMGLPLEVLLVIVSVLLIPIVWPFAG